MKPETAIRRKCYQCSGSDKIEVLKCPVKVCPLYEFRCPTESQIRRPGKRRIKKRA